MVRKHLGKVNEKVKLVIKTVLVSHNRKSIYLLGIDQWFKTKNGYVFFRRSVAA